MTVKPPPLPDTKVSAGRQTFHYLVGASLFWPVSVVALALFHVDAATWLTNKTVGTKKTDLTTKFFNRVDDYTNHSKVRKAALHLVNAAMTFVAFKYYSYAIPKEIEKAQERIKEIQEQIINQQYSYSNTDAEITVKSNWREFIKSTSKSASKQI